MRNDNQTELLARILVQVEEINQKLGERIEGSLEIINELPVTFAKIVNAQAPWILKMKEYEGFNEFDHKSELGEILWDAIDPESIPWCASILTGILEACGIDSPKSNRSTDYANWGIACPAQTVGAVVVWRGHVAIYLGDNLIIGGNQSNECNIMQMNYVRRDAPIAWRIPNGWTLPTA